MWWADQGTDQIGTCDKKDGGNWKVMRNSTSPLMHLKIYNETVQKGAALMQHLFFVELLRLTKREENPFFCLLEGLI